ncbi:Receptor ligand binding region [Homalodisca vitripennis]|nr:Receptor ligand binding region [Homalodisca vitripennis]
MNLRGILHRYYHQLEEDRLSRKSWIISFMAALGVDRFRHKSWFISFMTALGVYRFRRKAWIINFMPASGADQFRHKSWFISFMAALGVGRFRYKCWFISSMAVLGDRIIIWNANRNDRFVSSLPTPQSSFVHQTYDAVWAIALALKNSHLNLSHYDYSQTQMAHRLSHTLGNLSFFGISTEGLFFDLLTVASIVMLGSRGTALFRSVGRTALEFQLFTEYKIGQQDFISLGSSKNHSELSILNVKLAIAQRGSLLAGLYLLVESTTGHSKDRCVTYIWATLWMFRSGTSLTANVEILGCKGGKVVRIALFDPTTNTLDFACEGCVRIVWQGSQVPIAERVFKLRVVTIQPAAFLVVASLASVGITLACAFLAFNLYFRRLKYIKLSSPRLNNMAVVGCILVYTAVILLGLDHATLPSKAAILTVCNS